jgi:AcrR family transcriptional regulator
MAAARISIGSIRRRQIIDAAWAIIAEQGLQKLSLSEIERKVGMSRGQLTYYFKAKEDILLAVFDRLMEQWRERGRPGDGAPCQPPGQASWEEAVAWILRTVLTEKAPKPEFHALQYTFLSQISHRDDFRDRLARLYNEWRGHMSEHLAESLKRRPSRRRFAPRALASVVQALIHGLAVQSAVEPEAIDSEAVIQICLDMLKEYLWPRNRRGPAKVLAKATNNGKAAPSRAKGPGKASAAAARAATTKGTRAARQPARNGKRSTKR